MAPASCRSVPFGVTGRRYPGARLWWLGAGRDATDGAQHRRVRLGRRCGCPGRPEDLRGAPRARDLRPRRRSRHRTRPRCGASSRWSPSFVRQQVETVLDDFDVRAVKTGMLATAAIVREVAAHGGGRASCPSWSSIRSSCRPAGTGSWSPRASTPTCGCCCPMRSSPPPTCARRPCSGAPRWSRSAPSRPGWPWPGAIRETGARYVVVKGGHLTESADDVVVGPDGESVLPGTRVATGNDHGTGCSLSAAVAANLALGASVPSAIEEAKAFVARALAGSARLAPRLGTRAPRPFRVVHPAVGLAGHDAAPHRQ